MKRNRFVFMLSGCALLATWSVPAQAAPVRDVAVAEISSLSAVKLRDKSCANPRGMKVRVRSFFTVTNSDDGVADNVVEVYGNVSFNGQRVWNVARDNARSIDNKPNPNSPEVSTTGPQRNEIGTDWRTFDVIFDTSSTWNLIVIGYMNDRDKGAFNKDDGMWNPFKMPHVVNMKQMSDRLKRKGQEQYFTLAGDRNSENADLTIVVSKIGDIF